MALANFAPSREPSIPRPAITWTTSTHRTRVLKHVAADYHGRFLIELIQNGNDAHDRKRRDGEIDVWLVEDEGKQGTLYVANRGNPFTQANLVALSRIGMSSKPPGEAIGNKGLGFRSVSHAPAMRRRSTRRQTLHTLQGLNAV